MHDLDVGYDVNKFLDELMVNLIACQPKRGGKHAMELPSN